MKRWQVITLKSLAGVLGTIVGLLVVIEIALSPAVATRLVNKYAPELMDADLTFGKAGISVFRNFPSISVRVYDATLTYPHDRFAEYEDTTNLWMPQGRAEAADTLASFDRFTGAVSVPALITGAIKIKKVELMHPRVFAKMYNDSTANWNIFTTSEKEEDDTTSTGLPTIKLRKVTLADDAHIVFSMPEDTLFAVINLDELSLDGKISTAKLAESKGTFKVDSLSVGGRMKEDTLIFNLDRMALRGNRDKFTLDAAARAYAALKGIGRVEVPLTIDAKAGYPKDTIPVVNIKRMDLNLAGIPFDAKGKAILYSDKYFVDLTAAMTPVNVGKLIEDYGPTFWAEAAKIKSDALLNLTATANGYYYPETGVLPELTAYLNIPKSSVQYKGVDQALYLQLDAVLGGGSDKPVDLSLDTFDIHTDGLSFDAGGKVLDLLGEDPDIDLKAKLFADLAKVVGILPEDTGINASGEVNANLSAKTLLSQLNMNKIGNAEILGKIESSGIKVSMPKDTISADLGGIDISLGATGNRYDQAMKEGERVLMLTASLDTLNADYKGMYARIGQLKFHAHNSADILSDMELSMSNVRPFAGFISAESIGLRDADSSMVGIRQTKDLFTMRPKNGNAEIPLLHVKSDNSRIFVRSGANRLMAKDFGIDVTAAMNTYEKKNRLKVLRDSLSNVYPEVPKDSVLAYAWKMRMDKAKANLPEWLQEEDFRKSDLDLALTGSLAKYFREWDLDGSINLGGARLVTPYLPLKNSLGKVSATFTNDKVNLKSFSVQSGESNLKITGNLTNLKRVLLGHGVLNLDLHVMSDYLNANELLAALSAGSNVEDSDVEAISDTSMSDEEFENSVVQTDLTDAEPGSSLIVIPANVNANIFLEANTIQYSTLDIDWVQAELAMKQRCLQITNTIAMSNMGNIYFDAFYSTKTKKDIKAGFSLDLEDITAEKVIDLVPAIDSLIPMLKSFSGLLNCSVAATTNLDEEMNIVYPSLNGVMRISGDDLLIDELGDLSKITRLLMFRNKKQIFVDHMQVEGLLSDNKVEIFPFILDIDRYRLALSGIQELDTSFKYHVSVMKSPLLFKFGINLNGNFDDFKFNLGKALYRRPKKVPSFSAAIDQSKTNLKETIKNIFSKGVENAIAANDAKKALTAYKDSLNYVAAVEQPMDTLDSKSAKMIEKMEAISSVVDLDSLDVNNLDSLQIAKLDSLGVSIKDLKKLAADSGSDDED